MSFETLRSYDARVATIGFRLLTANAALCRRRQPELGVAWQALDQFDPSSRPAARAAFGFERAVVAEAVVPGAPAARAGVVANDSLTAIDGVPLPEPSLGPSTTATRDAAEARLASLPSDASITLALRHDGRDRTVTVQPVPGCRTALEMVIDNGWLSDSDGERLRIGSRFLECFSDEQIAAILAHELAHTILDHHARLAAAKVTHGLMSGLGRQGRLIRQTEDEADRLSVSLLYNAGYDPAAASRFWHEAGPVLDGPLRDGTHRSAAERADLTANEAATIPAGAPRPYMPAILATRETPLR